MYAGVLAWAVVLLASGSWSMATTYDFLTVQTTGAASSRFNSSNLNGYIDVTDTFPSGGAGGLNNVNSAIFPSQFTTLFPGTGQVQGHLAMTVYNYTSVVTFTLANYNLSSSTVFGMWNTTDEVSPIPGPGGGGIPVYQILLLDANNNLVPPTTFNLIGNQDNQTQVSGRHQMTLNTATGEIAPGILLNQFGTHTDAAFWDNIPAGTKEIRVYANLAPLNTIGDGVGYYFAEAVPEPGSMIFVTAGMVAMGGLSSRRFARRRALMR